MQFCIKCGKELPSDAVFCPKCGEKAVISKAEIVEANNNSLERNVKVDAASLNKLGVTKTAFANRVEASDDPMVNERLFTLYGKLIAPVSKIEQLTDLVKKCKGEIKRRKFAF